MSSIYQSRISAKDVPRSSIMHTNLHATAPFSRISRVNRNQREPATEFGGLRGANLANLISPAENSLQRPVMKKLASTHNHKLILNEPVVRELEALYPNNLLAFYAVYGQRNAGKSFWCDRTYDLSDVGQSKGYYYTRRDRQQGVHFLNVPFTKGDIKIFLLDCTGFAADRLSRAEEIRLDFIMSLSSAVLLLPMPEDRECKIMNSVYRQFLDSQKRLRMFDEPASKRSAYWPHSCYCLYRTTEPVSKNLEDLGLLFSDYNFSIIQDARHSNFQGGNSQFSSINFLDTQNSVNHQYLSHISYVTRDVYDKIWGKRFGNLKSYGKVMSKLIPYLALSMNAREIVPMEKVFDDTTKALYEDTVKKSSIYYGDAVKNSFPDSDMDRPLDSKTLTNNFNTAKYKTYDYFDNQSRYIDPTSKYAEEAEFRIDDVVNSQEARIWDINKKSSIKHLEKSLPYSKDQKIQTHEDFRSYLMKLKNTDPEIDQGRSEPISQRLKEACDQSKKKVFIVNEDSQKILNLQQGSDKKRSQILSLEKRIREKQNKQTNVKESIVLLTSKGTNLDSQIERLRRRNEAELDLLNNPNQEEADRQRIDQITESKKQYERRLAEIEKEKHDYNKWHQSKDNVNNEVLISTLLTKLDEKKKEKEKHQSAFFTSQLTSKLTNSGIRGAQVRPVMKDSINRSRLLA